jgi:hypothetical protein
VAYLASHALAPLDRQLTARAFRIRQRDAGRFRKIAEECRVQAAKATSPRDREAWLRLAEDWIDFAVTTEAMRPE